VEVSYLVIIIVFYPPAVPPPLGIIINITKATIILKNAGPIRPAINTSARDILLKSTGL
jgi:hypothetical protein